MAFRILPAAMADIRSISLYIAQDNPRAARSWALKVKEKCRSIGQTPGMGIYRPELAPDLRFLPVGRYLIFYRQTGPDVEIVRVLHGARNWPSLLSD
jgi:toxin ParE1/3/4